MIMSLKRMEDQQSMDDLGQCEKDQNELNAQRQRDKGCNWKRWGAKEKKGSKSVSLHKGRGMDEAKNERRNKQSGGKELNKMEQKKKSEEEKKKRREKRPR